jgi:glycosyltransferase involved in cell wall biosynthesis
MTGKTRVGVFHPGTQHSWQSALAFQESEQLGWYATSVFYDSRRWPYRIESWLPAPIASRLHREFQRRYTPLLDPDLVRTFGFDEWLETAAQRMNSHSLAHRFNIRGNRRFADSVIKLIEREPVDVVWGYDSASLDVFRWAKRRGIKCILDQTIGHPRSLNRIMAEEQRRYPDFFPNFNLSRDDAWIRQEDEEVALADLVVVGCEFAYQSMIENDCPAEKLRIVPYGFDESLFPDIKPPRRPLAGRPVEFLFVGAIHPRKGVAYLLEAFEAISPDKASLTLVGVSVMPPETLDRYAHRVRHIPQIPRSEVAAYFRQADVFIFPSLFEGGGIVLHEAIGAGLGIIQSTASAIVVSDDNSNGIILDQVSVQNLIEAIEYVISNPNQIEAWSDASWDLRPKNSWHTYRSRVRGMLGS